MHFYNFSIDMSIDYLF